MTLISVLGKQSQALCVRDQPGLSEFQDGQVYQRNPVFKKKKYVFISKHRKGTLKILEKMSLLYNLIRS